MISMRLKKIIVEKDRHTVKDFHFVPLTLYKHALLYLFPHAYCY